MLAREQPHTVASDFQGGVPLKASRRDVEGEMKYFLDTEFIERGREHPIQLISLGIVCENGHEFYAVSSEYDPATASDWVKHNVLPYVGEKAISVSSIVAGMRQFVEASCLKNADGSRSRYDSGPEFWGYYADYDWVVFCQLFGTMMDLPKGWPMYCRDIKQLCDSLGNPKLPKQTSVEHNALTDAKWNKEVYEFLVARST